MAISERATSIGLPLLSIYRLHVVHDTAHSVALAVYFVVYVKQS